MDRSDLENALRRNRKQQRNLKSVDADGIEDAEEQLAYVMEEISDLEDERRRLESAIDTLETREATGEEILDELSDLEDEERRIRNYMNTHFPKS